MIWKTYHTKGITEKYLFKFLSLENAERFLSTGCIWFSLADIFGDKMECVRIQDLKRDQFSYEELKDRQQKFLISCWHLADSETVALWDTHSKNENDRKNVAIRFEREHLINYMRMFLIRNSQAFNIDTEFTFGRIAYRDIIGKPKIRLSTVSVNQPAFRKEAAFSYEKEFRFVIRLKNKTLDNGHSFRLDDTNTLPFKIIVNPYLEDEKYSTVTNGIIESEHSKKLIVSRLIKWAKPELF